jgi:Zn finger protein HypA/HybF involved in hydrogenase expression
MARKKTQEEFEREVSSKLPGIEIKGVYRSVKSRVAVRCTICGNDWSPLAGSLLAGHGCPVCMRSAQITEEAFRKKLAAKRDDVALVGKYVKATEKTEFKFLSCGHTYHITPSKILSGRGCPVCSGAARGASQRLSLEEFERRMKGIDPNLRLAEGATYKNKDTPVALHCDSCGQDIKLSWGTLRYSSGCPNCHRRQTSYMEQYIYHSFVRALSVEKVISRDREHVGTELDILIPSLGFAVEPGSWYFHVDNMEHDLAKKDLCEKKGIRLITVFDHYPDGQKAPFEGCLTYPFDLSARKNIERLKSVVATLFAEAGIPCSFTVEDWEEIDRRALKDTRRMTTEEFRAELGALNPDIEFHDTYSRALDNKMFRCRVCGHEWKATPTAIRQGSGCPKCAGHLKVSVDEFIKALAEANPTVELLDKTSFTTKHGYSRFRCLRCGNEWTTRPYHLVARTKRTGCPACSGNKPWTHDEFVRKMSEINPRLRVLGTLRSTNKPIEVECLDCGRTWTNNPSNLLKGQGCRQCKCRAAGERMGRKVQCIDTGEVFPSIAEAARKYNVSSSRIVLCCQGKHRHSHAGGMRWRYMSPDRTNEL